VSHIASRFARLFGTTETGAIDARISSYFRLASLGGVVVSSSGGGREGIKVEDMVVTDKMRLLASSLLKSEFWPQAAEIDFSIS
jgi:hypothetical protein